MNTQMLRAMLVGCLALWPAAVASGGDAGWKQFFPLRKDSRWTYELTNHRSRTKLRFTAVVKGPLYIPEMKRTLVIVDEDQLGEHHPVGYFEDEQGFLNRFLYLEYAGEKVTYPGTNSTPQRVLPAHPKAAKAWEDRTVVIGSQSDWQYRVKGGLKVKVAAGRFKDCILVETEVGGQKAQESAQAMHRTGQYRFKDWYAAGVGLIRSETYNEEFHDSPEVSYELVQYKLR